MKAAILPPVDSDLLLENIVNPKMAFSLILKFVYFKQHLFAECDENCEWYCEQVKDVKSAESQVGLGD